MQNVKNTKQRSIAVWVKKRIKAREWNSYYNQVPGYCFLGEETGGVVVGFLVANKVPFDCERQTPIDLIKMQECLESINSHPRPFDKNEK